MRPSYRVEVNKVKARKWVASGLGVRRRPSVEETTRALLASAYPNASGEELDEAAELLAEDLESEGPEPEGDELTATETESVERLRYLLKSE